MYRSNDVSENPALYGLCAGIGGGKTSVIRHIGQPGQYFLEPLESWKSVRSTSSGVLYHPLDDFYKNAEEMFEFQTHVINTYMTEFLLSYKQAKDDGAKSFITERTPWDCLEFFSKMGVESKLLSEKQFALLESQLYNWGRVAPFLFQYEAICLLRVDAEIQHQRIQRRHRQEEMGTVDVGYLQSLNEQYERFDKVDFVIDGQSGTVEQVGQSVKEYFGI